MSTPMLNLVTQILIWLMKYFIRESRYCTGDVTIGILCKVVLC